MSQVELNNGVGRARAMAFAAGAAMSIGLISAQAEAQIWISPTSGMFGDSSKWLGAAAPVSDSATALTFALGNVPSVTATVDAATYTSPFVANALTFTNAGPLTVAGDIGMTVLLGGTNPTLYLSSPAPSFPTQTAAPTAGPVSSVISAPITLGGNLTFGGAGIGNLQLSGARNDDGTTRTITIPALPASLTTTPAGRLFHTVVLGGTWTSTATPVSGLVLDGGNMQLVGPTPNTTAFGPAGSTFTVTANGGVIQLPANPSSQTLASVAATSWVFNGPVRLEGGSSGGSIILTPTTVLSGAGTLTCNAVLNTSFLNALTIQSDSIGYTGAIVIDKTDHPMIGPRATGVSITGTAGRVGSTSVTVRSGGTMALNSPTGLAFNDRLPDTADINLASGIFTLTGGPAGGFTETVHDIICAGSSAIGVSATVNATTLSVNSITRSNRGACVLRGTSLGNTTATIRGNLVIASPPALVGGGGIAATTTMSIIPWAIGDTIPTGNGSLLVTMGASGVRTLSTTTEQAGNSFALSGGLATNARLTLATATSPGSTINSLTIASGGSVTGTDALTVNSGLILNTTATRVISAPVAFGGVEGHVYCTGLSWVGSGSTQLTINGQLTGSDGFTKSGGGLLTLTADNSGLTGPLTINAGHINFNAATALPGTGQIATYGTGNGIGVGASAGQDYASGLVYSGASALDLTRGIALNSGLFNITSTTAPLTLSGTISGTGGLFIQSTGDVYLTGTNDYTGPTFLLAGTGLMGNVHISSDANFGNGGGIEVRGNIVLDGDWTTARYIDVGGTGAIDTNGFTATLNGPMGSFTGALNANANGVLTKNGLGTLTINSDASALGSGIIVNAGTLSVNGTIPPSLRSTANVAIVGGTLSGTGTIYRDIAVSSGAFLAPGNSAGIFTEYGNLTLNAGSTFAVELNGATPGNGAGKHDQLRVNGTVSLTDANLAITLGYTPVAGAKFFILTNDDVDAITGTFAGLPDGSSVTLGTIPSGTVTGTISYFGDAATGATSGGNDVVIHTIVLPVPPCRADVAGLGGGLGPDGQITVDDLVAYLGQFFAGNAAIADLVGLGGGGGPDGLITVDDLVAFLGAFFAGCP